jgi:NADPH:quinone reductase-like Zn-dependent oxidoreductase
VKYRRVVASRHGGPEVLQVVEEHLPAPAPGEVRVKVMAAGVSHYDVTVRSFWFPGNPRVPYTPGEDVVGVVDKLSEEVSTFEPGQVVAGWTFGAGGGYAESLCRPADELLPVPAGLDPAEAVCLVVNYLTAHLYLHMTARVKSGERVLIHGAAGGLGTALLQLGGLAGLEMYGTASRYNHELVTALGAVPIDYHTEDFVKRMRSLTGSGADVVFDPIGGPGQLWRSYRALRKGGRLVPLGSVATTKSGMRAIPLSLLTVLLLKLIPDGKRTPLTPNMTGFPFTHKDWYRETLAELLDSAAAGRVRPVVAARIPLGEAVRAHELLERGGYAGKVVLVTGD